MLGTAEKQARSGAAAGRSGWGKRLRLILLLIVAALVVRSFVVAPFSIPSRSMTPTMLVGDYLFVAKWPYGYSRYSLPFSPPLFEGRIGSGRPERGDIVVFRSPAGDDATYVKRVIGLPGDRVQLVSGQLYINGDAIARDPVEDFAEPVADPAACPVQPGGNSRVNQGPDGALTCLTPRYRETLPGGRSYLTLDAGDSTADTTPEITVPEGRYFVLGDDRDRSADSRFPAEPGGGVGLVPEEHLIGRALVIFWSAGPEARWYNPVSWITETRWDRIGRSY